MKLVTFDEGRVGRLEATTVVELACGSTREYFERGGRSPRPASGSPSRDVRLRAPIVPEEVLPHGRQLLRPPRGAPGGQLVAPGAQGHRVLPERRRDHRTRRRDRLSRGPDQGARLRARARASSSARAASSSGPTRPRTTSPATWSSTTSPLATSSAARCSPASSRSPRRSTRSARSGRGSSPRTRCPTRTRWRWSCGSTARCGRRATPRSCSSRSRTWSPTTRPRATRPATSSRPARSPASPRSSPTRSTSTSSPGDQIEAEIEGIGVLRNHVVPWSAAHDTPAVLDRPLLLDAGLTAMRFGTVDGRFVLVDARAGARRRRGVRRRAPVGRPGCARAVGRRARVGRRRATGRQPPPSPTSSSGHRSPTRARSSRSR